MRILVIVTLITFAWTGLSYLIGGQNNSSAHPSTLGLAVVGAGTLAAYEWLKQRDARRATPPYKQAFDAVAARYSQATTEAAEEATRESAEHAA